MLSREERTRTKLHQLVEHIYSVFLRTEADLYAFDLRMTPVLPREITFLTSQELEDEYPTLTPKQRENVAARKYGAVFIENIGGPLRSGRRMTCARPTTTTGRSMATYCSTIRCSIARWRCRRWAFAWTKSR